jgi:hypothetical protein
MPPAPLTTRHVVSRVAASLLGVYSFVWGLSALGITLGVALGADYHEAETLMHLVAFLVFVAAFFWAYVATSVRLVWGVLAGGGGFMTGAAWALSRTLL